MKKRTVVAVATSLTLCGSLALFAACGKSDADFIIPEQKQLVYTGAEQELVTAGIAEGGTVEYKLNDGEWSTEVPTATEAGSYTVSFRLIGDENHKDVPEVSVVVTIAKAANSWTAAPVPASDLVYSGSAQTLISAATATAGTVEYKVGSGEWSESLPTGTDAGEYTVYYKTAGSGNYAATTGNDHVSVTIAKADGSGLITAAPVAAELTYTGEAQALVAAGTANGGTMQYKVGDGAWSAEIPTAVNAGEYTVYYKAAGDSNHNDSAESTVSVSIAKATATATAPAAVSNLSYTGEAQALITAGTANGGTMQYKVADGEWSTEIPTAITAGDHTVFYKAVGDSNHNDSAEQSINVVINKVAASVANAPAVVGSLVYTGSAQALVNAGTANGGTMQYKVAGGAWSAEIPTGINAGDYAVYYKVVGDSNHNDTAGTDRVTVSIAKANASVTSAPVLKAHFQKGATNNLIQTAAVVTGGTVMYKTTSETYGVTNADKGYVTTEGVNTDWAAELPSVTTSNRYSVYYKVVGDENHNDVAEAKIGEVVVYDTALNNATIVPSWGPNNTQSIQLKSKINENINGYYLFTGDMNLKTLVDKNDNSLYAIEKFNGVLDGDGYAINNAYLNCDAGKIGDDTRSLWILELTGVIRNLKIEVSSVKNSAGNGNGGLVKDNRGVIENCYFTFHLTNIFLFNGTSPAGWSNSLVTNLNYGTVKNVIVGIEIDFNLKPADSTDEFVYIANVGSNKETGILAHDNMAGGTIENCHIYSIGSNRIMTAAEEQNGHLNKSDYTIRPVCFNGGTYNYEAVGRYTDANALATAQGANIAATSSWNSYWSYTDGVLSFGSTAINTVA